MMTLSALQQCEQPKVKMNLMLDKYIEGLSYLDDKIKVKKEEDEMYNNDEEDCKNISGRFTCGVCYKWFFDMCSLKVHMSKHVERAYHCPLCGSSFKDSKSISHHKKFVHCDERRYACDMCDKSYKESGNLKKHKERHSGLKPYVCHLCEKAFFQKGHLKDHVKKHSVIKEENMECNNCGLCHNTNAKKRKNSSKNETILSHYERETNECDICDKQFCDIEKLKRHKALHNPNKKFKCGVCGKGFVTRARLERHSHVHSGQKNFQCDKCDKSYTLASNLKRHQDFHNGVKFVCDICGQTYTMKSNMKRHMINQHSQKVKLGVITL